MRQDEQHQWELEQQERIELDPVYRAEYEAWLDKTSRQQHTEEPSNAKHQHDDTQ